MDKAQLDDPSNQHNELVTSPCPHRATSGVTTLRSLEAADEQAAHRFHASSSCWCKYPQSLYPNWTYKQQQKSKISTAIVRRHVCRIHYLDMKRDATFVNVPHRDIGNRNAEDMWELIKRGVCACNVVNHKEAEQYCQRSSDVHLRMLFVDNCSGPVLQILGSRYNIEPFFFSSTIGWIPTRFQSNVIPSTSDRKHPLVASFAWIAYQD